jgi:hypothetical protein
MPVYFRVIFLPARVSPAPFIMWSPCAQQYACRTFLPAHIQLCAHRCLLLHKSIVARRVYGTGSTYAGNSRASNANWRSGWPASRPTWHCGWTPFRDKLTKTSPNRSTNQRGNRNSGCPCAMRRIYSCLLIESAKQRGMRENRVKNKGKV